MEKNKTVRDRRILRKAGILFFWLCVWQLLALWVDNDILFVSPWQTVNRFAELLWDMNFWRTVLYSMGRIGMGFLLGTLTGLLLAALSSRVPLLEEVFNPIVTLCKSVPVASFVVLFLIWWGSARLAVAVCLLIVLPNIYISTLEGIRSTDKRLCEMAEVFNLPLWNRFFYIYRPALRPFLDSSLKLSLGMCWKSGVAAEVIGTPEFSIGEQLYFSKIYLDTAGVFAWTIVIILLSVCFERLILWLVKCFFAWEPMCRKVQVGRKNVKTDLYENDDLKELRITHLNKKFGEQVLFRDYNAVFRPGRTEYFTSPSGSGKTTLFRMLVNLEQADSGKIAPVLSYGIVFQEDRLCEEYSALRNVEMVVGDGQKARNALLCLLEEEAIYKPCSQLSGGMKRRVALVRAMESEAECILLDEPYTGMDAETRERVEKYIMERQKGRILLIATHI